MSTGFIRHVRDPLTVGRELTGAFLVRLVQEDERLAITGYWKHPEIVGRVWVVTDLKQEEPSV
jgi:hypothetical protein